MQGKRVSPKNLEAFADNLVGKLVEGDLEVENWDPLSLSGVKDMKVCHLLFTSFSFVGIWMLTGPAVYARIVW